MHRFAAIFLLVAITLAGGVFAQQKPSSSILLPEGEAKRARPATDSVASADDLLWKKLDVHVSEMVEKFDGVMGVAIVDLTDGRAILKNADRVFPTASSIKIAILLELYYQEQQAREGAQGKARLNDV